MMEGLAIGGLCLAGLYVAYKSLKSTQEEPEGLPTKGYVYIVSNPAFSKGIFKIGFTTRDVSTRMQELYTTGVPHEFVTCIIMKTDYAKMLEADLHRKYRRKRLNGKREFFKLDESDLKHLLTHEYLHSVDPKALQKALTGSW